MKSLTARAASICLCCLPWFDAAAMVTNKTVTIKPSDPVEPTWGVTLQPKDTANFTVNIVNSEVINGVTYVKTGGPWYKVDPDGPAWSWKGGSTSFTLCNESPELAAASVVVSCRWSAVSGGGEGGGAAPDVINGSASALADLRIGHIEWVTGTSPMPVFGQISWTVKLLKENGQLVEGMSPRFNMSAVSVTPPCSWEISPNTGPGPELDGSVTATNGSKGKLRADYDHFGMAKHSICPSNLAFVCVDKLQYRTATNQAWIDAPTGIVFLATNEVDLLAMRKPTDEPWPAGKPVWGGCAGGSGADQVHAVLTPGTVRSATAECGNMTSVTFCVLSVDITDPAEDDVHLVGEEVKFDGELEPTGLSGVTYAWSVLEGTCDPATATTEDFQTTLKSEGTIKVKLAVTVGGTTCEKIRTIKAVLPEVTKLRWENDHDLLQGATGSSAITDPVWTKTLGGAVTKNEPGAYTKDGYATAELEIEGDSTLTHSISVQVKGDGNTENFAAKGATFHNWTWSSGELQLDSSPLYASVNFYDTLDVTWYYRVEKLAGGWGDWVEMNQSEHVLYTTLTTPTFPEATPHVVILSNACHWAANQQTPDSVGVALLDNGFKLHYVWDMTCAYLSSDFVRLNAAVGVSGSQHNWASKGSKTSGNVGWMCWQRTKSFTPVGGSAGVQEWSWHQWAETAGSQRDPSAAAWKSGGWGGYEDDLFTHYYQCTNSSPFGATWVANQSGQSSGCEIYPTNCTYSAGYLLEWSGPPGPIP